MIKKIKKNAPYIFLFCLIFLFYVAKMQLMGDDIYFKEIGNANLLTWLSGRYQVWSSRLIIEAAMVNLLQLPIFIFYMLNALLVVQLAVGICKLLNADQNLYLKWIICLLTLIYPLMDMSTAGWVATCLNYLWPLSFGVIALLPLKKAIDGASVSCWCLLYSAFSLIFACNQEQMCALIVGFYAVGIGYMLYRRQKVEKYIWLLVVLAVASLLFIVICPGNGARYTDEIDKWYPQYGSYGLLHKTVLGVASTVATIFSTKNWLFLLLVLLLAYMGIKNINRGRAYFFISCTPALIYLFFTGFLQDYLGQGAVTDILLQFSKTVDFLAITKLQILFAFGVSCLFVGAVVAAIFVQKNMPANLGLAVVMLAGFASRFIMGFSPTVYASSLRTFIFLYFAAIFCLGALTKKLSTQKEKNVWLLALLDFAAYQYVGLFLM